MVKDVFFFFLKLNLQSKKNPHTTSSRVSEATVNSCNFPKSPHQVKVLCPRCVGIFGFITGVRGAADGELLHTVYPQAAVEVDPVAVLGCNADGRL